MREIKFRLRIGDEVVGYEWWDTNDPLENKWVYSKDNRNWSVSFIPHTDKDQFTGLCDKKGVEGYHKDICKDEDGKQWGIAWITANGCWALLEIGEDGTYIGPSDPIYELNNREIIGNVFQNKDLLKEKP